MLVYLDTAQLAWLESASVDEREAFLCEWRELGCELAVSLQLLQEGIKRGSLRDAGARIETIRALAPLRGLPTAAASVIREEATEQIRAMLQGASRVPAVTATRLFPFLDPTTLSSDALAHAPSFKHFNAIDAFQAAMELEQKGWPRLAPGMKVEVAPMLDHIRQKADADKRATPELADWIDETAGAIARDVVTFGGDLWALHIHRLQLGEMRRVNELNREDLFKASQFLHGAREGSKEIGIELDIPSEQVLSLVGELDPYNAPGFSAEMAVTRARWRDLGARPKASDQVDEEHVSFAPYVDLLCVDKRTMGYLRQELRRADGRAVPSAGRAIIRPRNLTEVLDELRLRAR